MGVRAAVFDYGHTFLDFALADDALLEVYERVRPILENLAGREVPEAPDVLRAILRSIGETAEESFRRGDVDEIDLVALYTTRLASRGFSVPPDVAQQILEMEHRALVRNLTVEPANLHVLRDLKTMGLKIGLVSNAHFLGPLMREDIERLGIAQYVDDAVFSSEIGVRKPHPAIFRKVLDELDVTPGDAIFVGDRLRDDIGGAQALGMKTVLTQEFRQEEPGPDTPQPDLVVTRLPDLVPWVESLVSGE